MKNKITFSLTLLYLLFFTFSLKSQNVVLVEKGRTSYQIVVGEKADSIELYAAKELQRYLFAISNVTLNIVADSATTSDYEIVIGKNDRLKEVLPMEEIPRDEGFIIYTDKEKLFIAGGGRKGTLYGVYEFLEKYLGCRMYAPDALVIPESSIVTIPQIKDIQQPVFSYRETLHLYPIQNSSYADWHKLHNRTDIAREWGMFVHTFQTLIPADQYFDTHPEWFSEINGKRIKDGQLCLSNRDMREELITNLSKMIQQNPATRYWSVSNNDNYNFCTCESCKALDKKFGDTPSGSLVWFINQVAAAFPDKIISTLAYQFSRKAPQNIVPADNVNIMLCSIECNRSRSFAEDPGEKEFRQDVEDWAALTHNIFMWDYVVQFRNYLDPFPNLHVLKPNLQFLADHGIRMMFEQGSGEEVTEFHQLRTYLIAKLLWNPYQDANLIINDFLAGYYGAAAPYIRQYIDIMQQALIQSGKRLDIYGFPTDALESYLTPALIKKYEALFDSAAVAVSDDKVLSDRISQARMPLEFAVLDIACSNMIPEISIFINEEGRLKANKAMVARLYRFVDNCRHFNIMALAESKAYTPEQFLNDVLNIIQKGTAPNPASGKPVVLNSACSPKYNKFGASALTDCNFGRSDYRHNWLGFEGNDMDAVIDLQEKVKVKSISVDFLEAPLSWIFLPVKVEFFVSCDGVEWNKVGESEQQGSNIIGKSEIRKFQIQFPKKEIRYVKVIATSLKRCPEWHRGFGNPCWIFADEIVVE